MEYNTGLFALLDIELLKSEKTHVEMQLPITSQVLQPFGYLHGGITISLLESAASIATENNADLDKELPFGVDVHVKHRKSGKSGMLRGVADLDHVEGNKWFWRVVAFDDEGDIISEGTIIVKIVSLERLKEKAAERER